LFFTAVLPPFLDLHRPLLAQLVAFAVASVGMDMLSMSAYGFGGAALSTRMTEPNFRRWFSIAVGCILLLAAVMIATRA
jgi:threonine/homoserine/homoserine lactone efflux protein